MHEDPITLHIALDKEQKAEGTLYIDDGQSFEYKEVEKRGNNDNKPVFIFLLVHFVCNAQFRLLSSKICRFKSLIFILLKTFKWS